MLTKFSGNSMLLWRYPLCIIKNPMVHRSMLSIQMNYRQTFLGEINIKLQIQNRPARRIDVHYRDRSVEISSECLSLQIQILS